MNHGPETRVFVKPRVKLFRAARITRSSQQDEGSRREKRDEDPDESQGHAQVADDEVGQPHAKGSTESEARIFRPFCWIGETREICGPPSVLQFI